MTHSPNSANSKFLVTGSDEEVARYFGNYLVGLAYIWQPLGDKNDVIGPGGSTFLSGFIVEIHNSLWWITSGHGIDQMLQLREFKYRRLEHFRLIQCYGTKKDGPKYINFDFDNARKFYEFIRSDEIDWAAIELDSESCEQLQANDIRFVSKEEWLRQDELTYFGHFMMGLPKDRHVSFNTECPGGYVIHGDALASAILCNKPLSTLLVTQKSAYGLFVGQLRTYDKGDIDGMSGGPIFGFVNDDPIGHRIIALQTGWDMATRIHWGFRVSTLAKCVEAEIDRTR